MGSRAKAWMEAKLRFRGGHRPRKDPGKVKGERAVSQKSGERTKPITHEGLSVKETMERGSWGITWKVQTQTEDYRHGDDSRGHREWSPSSVVALSTCVSMLSSTCPLGLPAQTCPALPRHRFLRTFQPLQPRTLSFQENKSVDQKKKKHSVVGGLWEGYFSDQEDWEKGRTQWRVDK